jgi:hypothetical protein
MTVSLRVHWVGFANETGERYHRRQFCRTGVKR